MKQALPNMTSCIYELVSYLLAYFRFTTDMVSLDFANNCK